MCKPSTVEEYSKHATISPVDSKDDSPTDKHHHDKPASFEFVLDRFEERNVFISNLDCILIDFSNLLFQFYHTRHTR